MSIDTCLMCFREEGMSTRDMGCSDLIGKTKKHLRSVLISEKGGVALDRLSGDYRELVSSFSCWICDVFIMFGRNRFLNLDEFETDWLFKVFL